MSTLKTIYLLRHGDRYDFEDKERWEKVAQRPLDPVLSDKGIIQSIKLGEYFRDGLPSQGPRITRCLSSPYVRCIQTINPLAGVCDAKICIEDSLRECVFTSDDMPSIAERASYFPRIDVQYKILFKPVPNEGFPEENMERYARSAKEIVNRFKDSDEAIVICTHAAGVAAMIASLLRCKVGDFNPVSPASIYRLDFADGSWTLHEHLCGSVVHLDGVVGETHPWPSPDQAYDTWGAQFLRASETASWMH